MQETPDRGDVQEASGEDFKNQQSKGKQKYKTANLKGKSLSLMKCQSNIRSSDVCFGKERAEFQLYNLKPIGPVPHESK